MKIIGIEGLSDKNILEEINSGGRFIQFEFTISILIMSFSRPTDIFFIKSGESVFAKGFPYTLISILFGWWGIPWGPLYTIKAIINNSSAKHDLTQQILAKMTPQEESRPIISITSNCPKCNEDISPASKFCKFCGFKIN